MQIQEWTTEQIELLKALALDGYSDKEITANLNIACGRRFKPAARASKRWAYTPGHRP